MTFGIFHDDHPRLTLPLPVNDGHREIDFIIDTGFAGGLALPISVSSELNAFLSGIHSFMLADGNRPDCRVYDCLIGWNGETRSVEILEMDGEPILGTRLLREMLLQVEMIEGGEVQIDPL